MQVEQKQWYRCGEWREGIERVQEVQVQVKVVREGGGVKGGEEEA